MQLSTIGYNMVMSQRWWLESKLIKKTGEERCTVNTSVSPLHATTDKC